MTVEALYVVDTNALIWHLDDAATPRRRRRRRTGTSKADALVYELYGLTEAEVAVVEGRG